MVYPYRSDIKKQENFAQVKGGRYFYQGTMYEAKGNCFISFPKQMPQFSHFISHLQASLERSLFLYPCSSLSTLNSRSCQPSHGRKNIKQYIKIFAVHRYLSTNQFGLPQSYLFFWQELKSSFLGKKMWYHVLTIVGLL